jgi:ABC-2 type transport system ATP-binding protein
MMHPAIHIENISKKYRTGFWGRPFIALDQLNLTIQHGEVLGYLGHNGAGKTTTFKVLLDLIRPDSGKITIFGKPANKDSRARIGFLPENPYFYMYLSAEESLHFHGRLKGMPKVERERRIPELLEIVGLKEALKRPLKKFSRGMLQRIGIAQALLNNPDILILDEPMSGLDPVGRKQMRNIILNCRDQGKTVIFSSHILSDVEMMCDRAAIIKGGKLQEIVQVGDMLENQVEHWEITCSSLPDPDLYNKYIVHTTDRQVLLKSASESEAKKLIYEIENNGGRVVSFGPQRVGLEDFYSRSEAKSK